MLQVPTLAELMAALDGWYPPGTAESWDAIGLDCGDPAVEIQRVLVAVDCVPATVAEATIVVKPGSLATSTV